MERRGDYFTVTFRLKADTDTSVSEIGKYHGLGATAAPSSQESRLGKVSAPIKGSMLRAKFHKKDYLNILYLVNNVGINDLYEIMYIDVEQRSIFTPDGPLGMIA